MSIILRFTERIYKRTAGIGRISQNSLSYYIQKIRKLLKIVGLHIQKFQKMKRIFILRDIFLLIAFLENIDKDKLDFCKNYNIVI